MWTLSLALSHVGVSLTLSVVTILLAAGRKNRALGIYALSFSFLAVCFILFVVRLDRNAWVTQFLANVMLGFSQLFFAWGIREYDGNPRSWPRRFWLYAFAYIALMYGCTRVSDNPYARNMVAALFIAVNGLEYIIPVVRGIPWLAWRTRFTVLTIMITLVLYQGTRFAMNAGAFISGNDVGNAERMLAVSIAFSMLFSVFRMCVVVLLDTAGLLHAMEVKTYALENLALKDELTGLLNRHTLDYTLESEMQRQDRYQVPLSMIMLDVDNFKRVNDVFGHDVGDIVLVEIARRVKASIRENDFLFRWGGEELLILVPNTSLAGASQLAEKVRRVINSAEISPVGKVSASFGVIERAQGEARDAFFKRVDQAMYRSKVNGKNRVETSEFQDKATSSMVRVEWQREWESGVAIIDAEHREMVRIGNELLNLSLSSTSGQDLVARLDALLSHIERHFADEEEILARSGYHGYESHRAIHEALLSDAAALRESFAAGHVSSAILFNLLVNKIILEHMLSEDMKFFSYIK